MHTSSRQQQCDDCKDWPRPCFKCRLSDLQDRHGCQVNVEDLPGVVEQIIGLEFLSNNPLPYRRNRRPGLLRSNESLATSIMAYSDTSVQPYNDDLALDVYLDALTYHSRLTGLNARVMALLVYLQRDSEALSFAESLSQWPTMRFNKEIWMECCDSWLDEVHNFPDLPLAAQVGVAIVKARGVAALKSDLEALDAFLTATPLTFLLDQVGSVLRDFLGYRALCHQERQLRFLFDVIDGRQPRLRPALSGILELENDEKWCIGRELLGDSEPLRNLFIWKTLQVSVCRCSDVRSVFASRAQGGTEGNESNEHEELTNL